MASIDNIILDIVDTEVEMNGEKKKAVESPFRFNTNTSFMEEEEEEEYNDANEEIKEGSKKMDEDMDIIDGNGNGGDRTYLSHSNTRQTLLPKNVEQQEKPLTTSSPSFRSNELHDVNFSLKDEKQNTQGPAEDTISIGSGGRNSIDTVKNGSRNHQADGTGRSGRSSNEKKKKPQIKKKKRGFFRMLGYEKFNTPITLVASVGSLILMIASVIRQAVYPTLIYCNYPEICYSNLDPHHLDIVILCVGMIVAVIILILSISIVMCPGALMNNPKRNKILAFYSIFFTFWACTLLIAPVAVRRHNILPYDRISKYNFSIEASGTESQDSAMISISNFYSPYYEQSHKRVMLRIYRTFPPFTSAKDIPPASHYFVYSDDQDSEFSMVYPSATINRTVSGLQPGTLYAFMALPVREGSTTEVSPTLIHYFDEISYLSNSSDYGRYNISHALIDFRIFRLCLWGGDGCY